MKTAMVFRADGKLQAIFKIDNEEKFKVVLKSIYEFPYFVDIIDEIPTLSSILTTESISDDKIQMTINDKYNATTKLNIDERVVVTSHQGIVCTLDKFNSIFN
jgi:hypothetical protein